MISYSNHRKMFYNTLRLFILHMSISLGCFCSGRLRRRDHPQNSSSPTWQVTFSQKFKCSQFNILQANEDVIILAKTRYCWYNYSFQNWGVHLATSSNKKVYLTTAHSHYFLYSFHHSDPPQSPPQPSTQPHSSF